MTSPTTREHDVAAIRAEPGVVHRVEDAPVHRLQAVSTSGSARLTITLIA
jgi:hypothetical protein